MAITLFILVMRDKTGIFSSSCLVLCFLSERPTPELIRGFILHKNITVSQLTLPPRPWEGIKGRRLMRFWRVGQPQLQMTRLIWELKIIFRSTVFFCFFFLVCVCLFSACESWVKLSASRYCRRRRKQYQTAVFCINRSARLRQMQHTSWTTTSTGHGEGTPTPCDLHLGIVWARGDWSAAFIDFQGRDCINAELPPFSLCLLLQILYLWGFLASCWSNWIANNLKRSGQCLVGKHTSSASTLWWLSVCITPHILSQLTVQKAVFDCVLMSLDLNLTGEYLICCVAPGCINISVGEITKL